LIVEHVIIGSGFSGLGMAIQLDRSGRTDWVLLEAAERIGGTWRDNTYPGAACDVPSHLYSYSFAPKPDWSHIYARQPEIRAYMEECVDRFALRSRIRLGSRLDRASWDEAAGVWELQISDGPDLRARHLIFAVGALREPRWPALPGLDDFDGPVLHSARWDANIPIEGQRVGVIGTGASAIQIVPALAGIAAHQTVFQRTAPWIKPRADRPYTAAEKRRFATVPGLLQLNRLRIYLSMESKYPLFFGRAWRLGRIGEVALSAFRRRSLHDPELEARCRPDYRLGCKRILSSDDWFPTLGRKDVDLVDVPIERVVSDGVILADGTHLPLDLLVCCTGFQVDQPLGEIEVTGRNGASLQDLWDPRPSAYLGTTVPGFPNLYTLFGPNTGLGHSSMILMIEAQIRYILGALAHLQHSGQAQLEVEPEAMARFLEAVDRRHAQRVWMSGCNSWYLGPDGSNFTLWPGSTLSFMARLRRFDSENYRCSTGP